MKKQDTVSRKLVVDRRKNYDRRSTDVVFQEGQFVWLRKRTKEKGLSPKLQPRWLGPYLIVSRLSDVTFRVQLTPRAHPIIVHADRMKRYEGQARPTWQFHRRETTSETAQEDEVGNVDSQETEDKNETKTVSPEPQRRYPMRDRRQPNYF